MGRDYWRSSASGRAIGVRRAQSWRYNDLDHRRELYRLILDTGDAIDVMTYLDVDELLAWSHDLPVARATRPALDRLVARTTLTAGV